NNTIRKITPTGEVTTFAGSPPPVLAGTADGVGAAAEFSGPFGITIDSSGILYVTDSRAHTIRKIEGDATVSTLAGVANKHGKTNGEGTSATFDAPLGITVDSEGNVYVADSANHTIRKITPSATVSTFAGRANEDVAGGGFADGVGALALFN